MYILQSASHDTNGSALTQYNTMCSGRTFFQGENAFLTILLKST